MLATTYNRLPQAIRAEALELRRALELTRMAGGAVDPLAYAFRRNRLRDMVYRLNAGRRAEERRAARCAQEI